MKCLYSLVLVLITLTMALPTLAAGYLKFDGVDGEATDKDHRGWIEILSVSSTASARDAASGLATGKRQHKPITIIKEVDKASPILARFLRSGKPLTNVHVEADGQVTVLNRAVITHIEIDSAGREVITLSPDMPVRESATQSGAQKKGNIESKWKVEEGEN